MLLIIFIQLISSGDKYFLQYQIFKFLILSTMFAAAMEAASWVFDGQSGQVARAMVITANSLLLACNVLPLMAWILYLNYQIYKDMGRVKKIFKIFAVFLPVNAFFALTAPINGMYFYVDAGNFYHRGDWSLIAIAAYSAFFIYSIVIVLVNWKHMDKRDRMPLLLFSFPPLIGFLVQIQFYGSSFAWAGVSLSILMAYITIQNQTISTDYLTGLYNRRHLDGYLGNRIRNLSMDQKFAGIMIDIDDFKRINDKYGHIVGDRAIEAVASILRRFFHYDDFISRYAGDEFVILINIKDQEALKEKVTDLQRQVALFNEKSKEPFEIQMSIGYAIYTPDIDQCPDGFLNRLDKLMYENKSVRRSR